MTPDPVSAPDDALVEEVAEALREVWPTRQSEYVPDWHPEDQDIQRNGFPELWRSFTERAEVVHQARLRRAARAVLATPALAARFATTGTTDEAVTWRPMFTAPDGPVELLADTSMDPVTAFREGDTWWIDDDERWAVFAPLAWRPLAPSASPSPPNDTDLRDAVAQAIGRRGFDGLSGWPQRLADAAMPAIRAALAVSGPRPEPTGADVGRLARAADEMDEYADGYAESGSNGLRLANFLTETADLIRAVLAAQQPQPVVQAFHGDDPTRPARDDDPVHDQDGDTSEEGPRG
jgi:hypothetical protein